MKNLTLISVLFLFIFSGCSDKSTGPKNEDPVIESLTSFPNSIQVQDIAEIICKATDPDDDPLEYIWETEHGSVSGYGDSVKWYPPNELGNYNIVCRVIDNNGGYAADSIIIQVENSNPAIDSLISSNKNILISGTITLTCYAKDPDNDITGYQWDSQAGSFSGTGSKVEWTAPEENGEYWISCDVTDANGASDSQTINIIVMPKPVAYYPFNQNADDLSENKNHGFVYGASLTEDRFGALESAYSFDGLDDFIDIGDVDILKIYGDLTLSLWFNSKSFEGLLGMITCQGGSSESSGANALYKINFNNKNILNYLHESGDGVNNGHEFESFNFNTNVWYYLVLVRNNSEKSLKLYVDGQLVETKDFENLPYDGQFSTLRIGENHGTTTISDRFFNGVLDDIRIYNKSLNNDEIQELFNE